MQQYGQLYKETEPVIEFENSQLDPLFRGTSGQYHGWCVRGHATLCAVSPCLSLVQLGKGTLYGLSSAVSDLYKGFYPWASPLGTWVEILFYSIPHLVTVGDDIR